MPKHFTIIAATSPNGGIGINGKLPWRNSVDMKYFKNLTSQRIDEQKINAVIMGRKTFESLKCKPLPSRLNICITSRSPSTAIPLFTGKSLKSVKSLDFGPDLVFGISQENVLFFTSLDASLKYLYKDKNIENIFVIGGAMLYREAIDHKDCQEMIINEIECQVECDAFFPVIDSHKYLLSENRELSGCVWNRRYIHKRYRGMTF